MDFRDEAKAAAATEGARRATGDAAAGAPRVPDPAVSARATRRRFSAEYKLGILREVERAKEGEIGAILRREGLYSSHLATWRRERDRIAKVGLSARRRGPKPRVQDPRVKQLERENARLQRKLRQAEIIIEYQKKVSELLGLPLQVADNDEND